MCRSIKRLRYPDRAPTTAELDAATQQFVRKVTGLRRPARKHQAIVEQAVDEITSALQRLFDNLDHPSSNTDHAA